MLHYHHGCPRSCFRCHIVSIGHNSICPRLPQPKVLTYTDSLDPHNIPVRRSATLLSGFCRFRGNRGTANSWNLMKVPQWEGRSQHRDAVVTTPANPCRLCPVPRTRSGGSPHGFAFVLTTASEEEPSRHVSNRGGDCGSKGSRSDAQRGSHSSDWPWLLASWAFCEAQFLFLGSGRCWASSPAPCLLPTDGLPALLRRAGPVGASRLQEPAASSSPTGCGRPTPPDFWTDLRCQDPSQAGDHTASCSRALLHEGLGATERP